MHRLVRIEGLHDFKYDAYLKFVLYDGSKYITLKGYIHTCNYIAFENQDLDASKLFKGFGIITHDAKLAYCKKHDCRCLSGIFPMHSSLEALKKTLLSFFDLNTDIKIPSIYKVGDKVQIKSEYDLSSEGEDYQCGFTDVMLNMGISKYTFTISAVKTYEVCTKSTYSLKHYKEPYYYELKEDSHSWSAAMFEGEIESKVQIEEIKDNDSTFKVYLTNGRTIELKIRGSAFLVGHNEVFKTCGYKIDSLSNFLHKELDCIYCISGYEPYTEKENIWIFIDDLKYRFGTEECKKTINPEFYKHLKKKPKQGIIEQIEYSQTKTQENAYQFCKVRGTVCRGNVPEGNQICGKRSKASVSSRPLGYRKVTGY